MSKLSFSMPSGVFCARFCFLVCLFIIPFFALSSQPSLTAKQFFELSPEKRVSHLILKCYYSDGKEAYDARFLDSLTTFPEADDDERLLLYIYLFRLSKIQHSFRDLASGTRAFEMERDRLVNCRFHEVRGLYNLYYGQFCNRFGKRVEGFKLMVTATKELEKSGFESLPFGGDYLTGLSLHYYNAGYHDIAIKYLNRASKCPFLYPSAKIHSLHELGLSYQSDNIRDYWKSAQNLAISYNLARYHQDSIMCFASLGYYARAIQLQGRDDTALVYLNKALQYRNPAEDFNRSVFNLYKAEILLGKNKLRAALHCIQLSDSLLRTPDPHSRKRRRLPVYYGVMSMLYRKTGQYDKVLAYTDSIILLKDSTNIVASNRILEEFETGINAEKYFSTLSTIENARAQEIQIGVLFAACFILIGAIIVYGFNQRSRQLIGEKELNERMKAAAEEKSARILQMLDQQVAQMQDKNQLIEKVNSELSALRRRSEGWVERKEEVNEHLDTILSSVIVTDTDWSKFKGLFEKVYPGFLERLSKKYTFLTFADLRLIALTKLNIPPREMAVMLGVTKGTIHKSMYRLRKKLESHQISVEDLIDPS